MQTSQRTSFLLWQLKNLFVESKHAVDIALMKRLLSVDIICVTEIQLGYWIKSRSYSKFTSFV